MNKKQLKAVEKMGFKVPDINSLSIEDKNINGLIIKDGTLILCNGFNEHRYIYPFLYSIGLVDSPDWTDDHSTIHISSGQLSGYILIDFANTKKNEKQFATMFRLRNHVETTYGDHEKVAEVLYKHHCYQTNYGGKFNGLSFLKKYYKNINLPIFSKKYKDVLDFTKTICVRTSPNHSLPGLLNSKFNLTISSDFKKIIEEINSEFEQYKNVVKNNKINYFFQQQIDGINGVCHVRGRDKNFTYAASNNQGDIVKGKSGTVKLTNEIEFKLKAIAFELANDFDKSIQLEFVISANTVFIVQLRLLLNEPEETVIIKEPSNALVYGKTFSHGKIDVNVNEIAIVSDDGDSSLLLGKKALIVTNDVEFSHLLALSKTLRIPSMYGTGNVDFGNKKTVEFVAYNKKSWIL